MWLIFLLLLTVPAMADSEIAGVTVIAGESGVQYDSSALGPAPAPP